MAGRGLLSRIERRRDVLAQLDAVESITEHLRVLLNTRKGESVTAPGFGVVDFTDLVHTFPAAIADDAGVHPRHGARSTSRA